MTDIVQPTKVRQRPLIFFSTMPVVGVVSRIMLPRMVRPAFFLLAFLSVTSMTRIAVAEEGSSQGEPSTAAIIERMAIDGRNFDPQPLLGQGVSGMRAVLDHIFPETINGRDDQRAKVEGLIEQLGDESFALREEASATLRKIGRPYASLLRQALEHKDLEVRFRARQVIQSCQVRLPLHAVPDLGSQEQADCARSLCQDL